VRYPAVAPRRTEQKEASADTLRMLFVGRDSCARAARRACAPHDASRRGVPVQTKIHILAAWQGDDTYVDQPSPQLVEREHARIAARRASSTTRGHKTPRLPPDGRGGPSSSYRAARTFGYVPIEALACWWTPLSARATNAMPEVIEDGRSGYLRPLELDDKAAAGVDYKTNEAGFPEALTSGPIPRSRTRSWRGL